MNDQDPNGVLGLLIFFEKIGRSESTSAPRSKSSPYAGIKNIEIAAHSTTEGFKYDAIDE